MNNVSKLNSAWFQAEREIGRGLPAKRAFLSFLDDAERFDWFRHRLRQLRREYEIVREMIKNHSYKNSEKQRNAVLVDFDVIRAYIETAITRNDYLYIKHFFEHSHLSYAIPLGAIQELQKYINHSLGFSGGFLRIDDPSNDSRILDRAVDFIIKRTVSNGNTLTGELTDSNRIVLNLLLKVLRNSRRIGIGESPKVQHGLKEVLPLMLKEIERSPTHYSLSTERKHDTAYRDSLNLAMLMDQSNRFCTLLTTSRYVINASKHFRGRKFMVVRPRLLSLFSDILTDNDQSIAMSRITALILALSTIDQTLLRIDGIIELSKEDSSIYNTNRLEHEKTDVWHNLKEIFEQNKQIINIEGKRSPLISFEWVRDELRMKDPGDRIRYATISYVRMLSMVQKCIDADEKIVKKRYDSKVMGRSDDECIWSLKEYVGDLNDVVALGEKSGPIGNGQTIARFDCRRNVEKHFMIKTEWAIDTGIFPLVTCLEDEFLSSIRSTTYDQQRLPIRTTLNETEQPGIYAVLGETAILFPFGWVANQPTLDFLYPWNLSKLVRSTLKTNDSRGASKRLYSRRILAIKLVIENEVLMYDITATNNYIRKSSISCLVTPDCGSRIARIWKWIGPRVLDADAAADSIGKAATDFSLEKPANE